jgi:hypothetical protein
MECLTPYIPSVLLPLAELLHSQTHALGVAALSITAVILGYLLIAGGKESPISFTIPLPVEIDPNWTGTKWEDLAEGEEKKIVEGQIRGVGVFLNWV